MQSLFYFWGTSPIPVQWNSHHFLCSSPSIIPHSNLLMKTDVQHRPLHYANPSILEHTTGNCWQTVDWLLQQPWCNNIQSSKPVCTRAWCQRHGHAPCQAMHPTAILKTLAVTLECTCFIACVQNYLTLLCFRWIGVPEFTVFWPSSVLRKTILLVEFTET